MLELGAKEWSSAHLLLNVILIVGSALPVHSSPRYAVLHSFGSGQDGAVPLSSLTFDSDTNLYGTTLNGGTNRAGVAYELMPSFGSSWNEVVLHDFEYSVEGDGFSTLVPDAEGNLYGSGLGGPNGTATVFELSPVGNGWSSNVLYNMGGGNLVLDPAGNLYGPIGPGEYKFGAIAELSPEGPNDWAYTVLYSFCPHPPQCSDGNLPSAASLFLDSFGNLFGTTLYGGNKKLCTADQGGCGVTFQLSPNRDGTWTHRLVHAFAAFSGDGQSPSGTLVVDHSGSIFGTTALGGPNSEGMVYRMTASTLGRSWVESTIYGFPDCSQGCQPATGLVADHAGNLYGAAGGGNYSCGGFACGVVYRLTPQRNGTWKYTILHKFNGSDGESPNGVTVGPDGTIYGTTQYGGQYNLGVAFQITP